MMAERASSFGTAQLGTSVTGSHLQRKLLLLLLITLAVALVLVILFQRNTSAPPMIFNAFADAVLGIGVGAGSRLVLKHRHWFVRALACAALAPLGLLIVGQLTAARSGIGPLQLLLMALDLLHRAGVRLAALPVFGPPPGELRGLAHIVLAVAVSWVTLRAWNGRRPGSGPADKTSFAVEPPLEEAFEAPAIDAPLPAASRLPTFSLKSLLGSRFKASVARPAVAATPRAPRLPTLRAKSRRRVLSAPRPVSRTRASALNSPRSARRLWPSAFRRKRLPSRPKATAAPARIAGSRSRWPGILRSKPHVRLAPHEQHRCPYCLEEVRRHDPRGSIECPVCHTFHHKDCWDITGTCQVPHLNV